MTTTSKVSGRSCRLAKGLIMGLTALVLISLPATASQSNLASREYVDAEKVMDVMPAGGLTPIPVPPARPASAACQLHPVIGAGQASWYGSDFHGHRTASGERFDMKEMTAAHKTLPLGTRVYVENPRTHASLIVRINDRGPFVKGRIIDVSHSAAQALGFGQQGTAHVVLRLCT